MRDGPTPLGALWRGLAAGLVGTGLMTLAQEASSRLMSSGEDGGGDGGPPSWDEASAPAKVARKVSTGVFDEDIDPERIPALTNGMHWAYGTAWGAVYGLAQGTVHARPAPHGLTFGTLVMGTSYAQLVPMGLSKPPWGYPPKDLATEWGFHAVYGLGVAAAFRALAGR